MEELDEEQRYVRKYLLNDLDEGERQAVEERLMTDSGYLKEVLITESELMEDYLDGTLSERDRERFEKYVLATERQAEKLALTKALRTRVKVKAAAHSPPAARRTTRASPLRHRISRLFHPQSRAGKFSAAAVVVIILFGAVAAAIFLFNQYRRRSLEQELMRLNTQAYLDAQAITHGYVIGPLMSGLSRDEEDVKRYAVPDVEDTVQIRLQIGAGDYQSFQAVFQTAEDKELFTIGDLKDRKVNGERVVIIYLPAKVLPPGDYQLRLSGLTRGNQSAYLGRYTFSILGK